MKSYIEIVFTENAPVQTEKENINGKNLQNSDQGEHPDHFMISCYIKVRAFAKQVILFTIDTTKCDVCGEGFICPMSKNSCLFIYVSGFSPGFFKEHILRVNFCILVQVTYPIQH